MQTQTSSGLVPSTSVVIPHSVHPFSISSKGREYQCGVGDRSLWSQVRSFKHEHPSATQKTIANALMCSQSEVSHILHSEECGILAPSISHRPPKKWTNKEQQLLGRFVEAGLDVAATTDDLYRKFNTLCLDVLHYPCTLKKEGFIYRLKKFGNYSRHKLQLVNPRKLTQENIEKYSEFLGFQKEKRENHTALVDLWFLDETRVGGKSNFLLESINLSILIKF
jgi:hypothetical protein